MGGTKTKWFHRSDVALKPVASHASVSCYGSWMCTENKLSGALGSAIMAAAANPDPGRHPCMLSTAPNLHLNAVVKPPYPIVHKASKIGMHLPRESCDTCLRSFRIIGARNICPQVNLLSCATGRETTRASTRPVLSSANLEVVERLPCRWLMHTDSD